MATWVHFGSIVAVQSKLEDSFTSRQSCGVLQCQLHRGSPPEGSTPSPSASAVSGQTTCASLTQRRIQLLLDVQPLQQAQRRARPPVQSPSDGYNSSWTYNHFSKRSAGTDHLCSLFSHPATDTAPPGRTTSTGCIPTGSNVFPFSKWWSRHRSSVMQRYSGILGADSFHRLWAWPAAILSWQTRSTSTSEARVSSL